MRIDGLREDEGLTAGISTSRCWHIHYSIETQQKPGASLAVLRFRQTVFILNKRMYQSKDRKLYRVGEALRIDACCRLPILTGLVGAL